MSLDVQRQWASSSVFLHPGAQQIHTNGQDQETLGVLCEKWWRYGEPPDYPPASLSCLHPICCVLLAASEGNKRKSNFESSIPIILMVLGPGLCFATQGGTEAASSGDAC